MQGKREKKVKKTKTFLEQLSFTEIKKLVDEGYEYFWSKPHRKMFRPSNPSFGYIDIQDHQKKESKEDFIDFS